MNAHVLDVLQDAFPGAVVELSARPAPTSSRVSPVDHTAAGLGASSLIAIDRLAGCAHPIRLSGSIEVTDERSGDVVHQFSTERDTVDNSVYVPCKTRRASRCESCAKTYQHDAYHLIVGGLKAGEYFDANILQRSALFVTYTAPSFGAVHSAHRDGSRCRPRRNGQLCVHGVDVTCWSVHSDDEVVVGQPICVDCFDYEAAVIWNASAGKLWRNNIIDIERALAKVFGVKAKELRSSVCRVRFVKVAEGQRRGMVHFHAAVRLDGPDGGLPELSGLGLTSALIEEYLATLDDKRAVATIRELVADENLETALLALAVAMAAKSVAVKEPFGETLKWGKSGFDVKVIATDADREQLAGYFAKYATKGADARGLLDTRIRDERQIDRLPVDDHQARLIRAAWKLANKARAQDEAQPPKRSITGGMVRVTRNEDDGLWTLTVVGGLAQNAKGRIRRQFKTREAAFAHLRSLEKPKNALRDLNLDRWAHQFGFRGHFLTKSREVQTGATHWPGWSTTFKALRQRRADHNMELQKASWQALSPQARLVIESRFTYAGSGYQSGAEERLAAAVRGSGAKLLDDVA